MVRKAKLKHHFCPHRFWGLPSAGNSSPPQLLPLTLSPAPGLEQLRPRAVSSWQATVPLSLYPPTPQWSSPQASEQLLFQLPGAPLPHLTPLARVLPLLFLFSPPPLPVHHFLPFLQHLFPEAPPSWLLGPPVPCGGAAGAGCVWYRASPHRGHGSSPPPKPWHLHSVKQHG